SPPSMQTTHVAEEAANMPHDLPLPGGLYTIVNKSGELGGIFEANKKVYGNAYTKLIMKVKKLKYKVKSSKARRRAKIVTSDDEDNQEDPSKQGRKIAQIDEDKGITLIQMRAQTQGRHEHDFENLILSLLLLKKIILLSLILVLLMYQLVLLVQKLVLLALKLELLLLKVRKLEEALRLQKQLDEEERQRIARVQEEASTFNTEEWDNIQAQIEADEELAHRLQAQEREGYSKADKARLFVELINERKRKFAQLLNKEGTSP
ncbi:hypothetical protein Tco_1454090, partial [Tanacetum coccineum]